MMDDFYRPNITPRTHVTPSLDKITGDETTDTKKARPSVILKLESASRTYPLLAILATKIFLAICGIIVI